MAPREYGNLRKQRIQRNDEDSFKIILSSLPAQAKFVKCMDPIVAFVGGLGSGKSRAAVYKAITLGFLNYPAPGIFIEPSYSLIRDVALPTFREVLEEMGLTYKIHITNYEIEINYS